MDSKIEHLTPVDKSEEDIVEHMCGGRKCKTENCIKSAEEDIVEHMVEEGNVKLKIVPSVLREASQGSAN
uniref:Uncharacterized protein n=1 Tax=Timema poppense TaxID=170557 RepID=A0A7R9DPG9_TIMPO|nr:unnamed protein product [Timema poppensis]